MSAAESNYCPACHSVVGPFLPGGQRGRPNAKCPSCGALERHRFLAHLLEQHGPFLATSTAVLDIAPQPQIATVLKRLSGAAYLATDLFADLDVHVRADLTRAPFANDSFDLIVGYHVLEHIPDDQAAMREIARILKPGGMMFMQVPWNRSGDTEENPDADVEERLRRFGQVDHVRLYGQDMEARLARNGLRPARIWPPQLLSKSQLSRFGIPKHGVMWILRASEPYELVGAPEVEGLQPTPAAPRQTPSPPQAPMPDRPPSRTSDRAPDQIPVRARIRHAAATGYHRLRRVDALRGPLDAIARWVR